jgi:quercetin dioxygenase-like cupin family protein
MAAVKVIKPEDRRIIETSGDICSFMTIGEETDSTYALMESIISPGGGPPPHIQHRNEEGFYVLEGELVFTVDGEEVRAAVGDFINIPKGVVHGFTNKTDKRARILVVMSPSIEEYYLLAVGHKITDINAPLPPTTPEDVQKYLTLAPQYGIEYVFAQDQKFYEGGTKATATSD